MEERLDRALITQSWLTLFLMASLLNFVAAVSDHSSLLAEFEERIWHERIRRFHFENQWLREEGLNGVVADSWAGSVGRDLLDRLGSSSKSLYDWGKVLAKHFREGIGICKKRIEVLQGKNDDVSVCEFQQQRDLLVKLLLQEEDFYWQMVKLYWFQGGDTNSIVFHRIANQRKKRNKISRLKDSDGEFIDDESGVGVVAVNYFSDLFATDGGSMQPVLRVLKPIVDDIGNSTLLA